MIDTITCGDGRLRLRAFGEFSSTAAESLRHVVGDSLEQGVHLLIDLSPVERVDAEGVSALVGAVRRARSVGGTAQVVNARPLVRATFELAGVYDLLLGSGSTTDDVAYRRVSPGRPSGDQRSPPRRSTYVQPQAHKRPLRKGRRSMTRSSAGRPPATNDARGVLSSCDDPVVAGTGRQYTDE